MGIPRLTTTLQPYADLCVLQDEAVVIDGPALAYHIIHVCRINGVVQPSYRLVGETTLAWLDELSSHQVVVQAIYFDGYLPTSKREIRMGRLMRNSAQIGRLFSDNPLGCPRSQIAAVGGQNHGLNRFKSVCLDVFKAGDPGTKPFADPSFFVPAVVDALRSSDRYRKLVRLVPGEADAVCARHVAEHGGLVLTSDSDLLVYDLEAGKVAFFRDLHRGADSAILCSSFTPRSICGQLGLLPSTGILRVAYELKHAPQATLPQLSRACEQPAADLLDFLEFYKQYQHDKEDEDFRNLGHEFLPRLTALDPRLSELVVQLYSPSIKWHSNSAARVFLPVLIENLDRGSAWQQSTPIRRLAYTLLKMGSVRPSMPILEHRRVQNVAQKGRLVETAPAAEAQQYIDEVLNVIERLKDLTCVAGRYYWPLVGLALDMGECQRQGKQSHAWHMFQQRYKQSLAWASKISWDIVHFFAQVQAALYSLRMLRQVLSIVREGATKYHLPSNAKQLWSAMLHFPSLSSFPDIDDILNLLLGSRQVGFVREFGELMRLHVPSTSELGGSVKVAAGSGMDEDIRKLAAKPISNKANMFGPLSID
ncbi:XPG domain-containing protein [Hirsutella rhossiliensis]|uniref:XPG domain-containing protein n=1 Tax=Hirsutella rhossiliensis TaxID=111463 RepID=A0A9P8MR51_9HYPO|nr:XPG domain-containing protein [Hirsutella rhossiliensis]KAH0960293.1 XPG domain-containing protein [Hirsutella rhossiliensis]